VLVAREARTRFLAQVGHTVRWCTGSAAHGFQRLRAREQQIALDEMREPEIGVRLENFFDFGERDVQLIVLDREQRLHQQGVGLDARGLCSMRSRDLRKRLTGGAYGRDGEPQRRGERGREPAEQARGAGQLPVRSCWISHLSPFLTITRVFVLVTSRAPDL
jgi:hypothetical protein